MTDENSDYSDREQKPDQYAEDYSRWSKTLSDLEWPQITERVAQFAASPMGVLLCRLMPLDTGRFEIKEKIAETTQARKILISGQNIPLAGLQDVQELIARIRKGASLNATELMAMGDTLGASRRMRNMLLSHKDMAPYLADMAQNLVALREVEKEIARCFGPGGEVVDDASPEIKQLRKKLRGMHATLIDSLNRIISSTSTGSYLQEEIFTIRNGRYVIPIKIEHKNKVEGIVHDLSGSGQSIYIEPRQVTELNNVLRTTELEIEQEIKKIFAFLTSKLAERAEDIRNSLAILSQLDFIFARARYADFLNASEPQISEGGAIKLRRLRHPLLIHAGEKVIPNDIEFAKGVRTLIITGPNTGGKTVMLKAVGLCALMLRAGMHLPVASDSEMAIFDGIFSDIGDEQSIKRNLSSFSARVLNLKEILRELTDHSLVLLDEIGEGTDPLQGQSLAQAYLEKLAACGATTIVTTHFSSLTTLAFADKGFANASVEFDTEALEPTYRFIQGVPGRSNAIRIALRLGLDRDVTRRAEELLAGETGELEDILERLEQQRSKAAVEARQMAQLREESQQLKTKHEKLLGDLTARRERLDREMAQEVQKKLTRAKAKIRSALSQVIHGDGPPLPKQVALAQAALSEVAEEIKEKLDNTKDLATPDLVPIEDWSQIQAGDDLFVLPVRSMGKLINPPDSRDRVTVLVRGNRMNLTSDKVMIRSGAKSVVKAIEPKVVIQKPASSEVSADQPATGRTCDLRGLYREEAIEKVETFLDAAVRDRSPGVFIIHGHGSGVLKTAVRQYLKDSPYSIKYRPGVQGEGGDGVTYVELLS